MEINKTLTDHTLIINELEKSIKYNNWNFILSFLPKGSFLVGGYLRDIILGRMQNEVDIDIVVPSNALDTGKKISDFCGSKFVILDKEREVVRIILNNTSIDIANQTSPTILGDLLSRDFSINSIAFSFDQKCLIDPLNGIKDLQFSLLRTYSEVNLLDDPLRILRCFRFVSELNFTIDAKLIIFIKKYKAKLNFIANERINYEIQKIVQGVNAFQSVLYLQKMNIFQFESFSKDLFLDLKDINCEELIQSEKDQFLPFFYILQILDLSALSKFKFSKSQILKTKLLLKWRCILKKRNISQLNELERFNLHRELEDILPIFVFYLPQNLRKEWRNRWRDKDDKLFHPSNLLNGDLIKKHLNMSEGPLLGKLLNYLSRELAYERLNSFDEAIYKAKLWIEQNAPKCD